MLYTEEKWLHPTSSELDTYMKCKVLFLWTKKSFPLRGSKWQAHSMTSKSTVQCDYRDDFYKLQDISFLIKDVDLFLNHHTTLSMADGNTIYFIFCKIWFAVQCLRSMVCSKCVLKIFLFFSFRLIGITKQWSLHKWKSTLYSHSRLPFSSGFVVRQRQEVIWTVVGSL